MTKTVQIPYGRFKFSTPDSTYELDKALENFDVKDGLNFIVQCMVKDQWIVQCYLGVHWNQARVAVLQALMASQVPVCVSVVGGIVIQVEEPDVDNESECGECGYNFCEHGFCACYEDEDIQSKGCSCWLNGEWVG